ncbi:MAG: hypothetical protein KDK36_03835 [Leptospiraceae bacterium]|nr:hypothetical protein [Leptospiraceae bacterium]
MKQNLFAFLILLIGCANATTTITEFQNTNHVEEGKAFYKEKKYSEAKESFSKAIKSEPENLELYQLRAFSSYGMGDYDSCIEDYDHILTKDKDGKYFKYRGLCFNRKGDTLKAKEDFETAMKRGYSSDGLVLTYYCDVLDKSGDRNALSYCLLAKNSKEKTSELKSITRRIQLKDSCFKRGHKPVSMEYTDENMKILMEEIKNAILSKDKNEIKKYLPCSFRYEVNNKFKYVNRDDAIIAIFRDTESIQWDTQKEDSVTSWVFERSDGKNVRFGLMDHENSKKEIVWFDYWVF